MRYLGPSNGFDAIHSIVIDRFGDVFVTGASSNFVNSSDMATVKFSSDGIYKWASRYKGQQNVGATSNSITIDENGNSYVTGSAPVGSSGSNQFTTIKYDSLGVQQWSQVFYSQIGTSEGYFVVNGLSSGIYVVGYSQTIQTASDFTCINYDQNGNQNWVSKYNGTGNSYDVGHIECRLNNLGEVILIGSSTGDTTGYDIATVKYSPAGQQLWVARYNGPANGGDSAMAMTLDYQGNIYVTGRSWGGSNTKYDYVTIKYNINGVQQWAARYDGGISDNDVPHAIATDNSGNVYVTGESRQPGGHSVYLTVKYSPLGVQQWAVKYEFQGGDFGYYMSIDKTGYVYVAGNSVEGIRTHAAIVKYSPLGEQLWVTRTQSVDGESAAGLAVDSSYNVYLGANDGHYLVIKYSQVIGIQPVSNEIPNNYMLKQNYPNPFNPSTNIEFSVPKSSFVTVNVYDALGREVSTLVNENVAAGTYKTTFNASNLASGMYYYKMTAVTTANERFIETKPMVLVK